MSATRPICPACRYVVDLLAAAGGQIVYCDWPTPEHLPNCPARDAGSINGLKVMTHIQLPDEP